MSDQHSLLDYSISPDKITKTPPISSVVGTLAHPRLDEEANANSFARTYGPGIFFGLIIIAIVITLIYWLITKRQNDNKPIMITHTTKKSPKIKEIKDKKIKAIKDKDEGYVVDEEDEEEDKKSEVIPEVDEEEVDEEEVDEEVDEEEVDEEEVDEEEVDDDEEDEEEGDEEDEEEPAMTRAELRSMLSKKRQG